MSVIIRVKHVETFRFCKVEMANFNMKNFLSDGKRLSFTVESRNAIHFIDTKIFSITVMPVIRIGMADNFRIYDNLDAEVPVELLDDVIMKYEKCEKKFLRIDVENPGDKTPKHLLVFIKV